MSETDEFEFVELPAQKANSYEMEWAAIVAAANNSKAVRLKIVGSGLAFRSHLYGRYKERSAKLGMKLRTCGDGDHMIVWLEPRQSTTETA